MPKETFFNLEKSKRDQIFEACVDEFAANPFSSASINQIIKKANISRGSFYQYFNDKEDCYMHVIQEIAKVKMDLLRHASTKEGTDLFESLFYMIDQTLLWIEKQPKYYAIGFWMDYDDSEFIQKLINNNQQSMDLFRALIQKDIDKGIIRKDIDVDILIHMLMSINKDILIKAFKERDFEKVRIQFQQTLDILKKGATHVSS